MLKYVNQLLFTTPRSEYADNIPLLVYRSSNYLKFPVIPLCSDEIWAHNLLADALFRTTFITVD